jgi:molybdate transport system ATP-binding protein
VIWDVDLQRILLHEGSRFELGVRFASHAPRLVLYGPSGAGKTQTLKMIAGVARPDSGRIAVAGRTLFDSAAGVRLSPQERRLACVFQDYALFPHLSVRQNIGFALRTGWLNPPLKVQDAQVNRWIAAFHLESVAGHLPHQISGGQRQRTALARALVNEPTALLLDEPFAALDKTLRQRLRDELRDLQAQLRLPMLLITHDDDDVRELADQVVYLQAGKVVDRAAAQEVAVDRAQVHA